MQTTLFVIGAFVFVFVFFKLETGHLKKLLRMDQEDLEFEVKHLHTAIIDLEERVGGLEK